MRKRCFAAGNLISCNWWDQGDSPHHWPWAWCQRFIHFSFSLLRNGGFILSYTIYWFSSPSATLLSIWKTEYCVGASFVMCAWACVYSSFPVCVFACLCMWVVGTTTYNTKDNSESQIKNIPFLLSTHAIHPLCTYGRFKFLRCTKGEAPSSRIHWPLRELPEPSDSASGIYLHWPFTSSLIEHPHRYQFLHLSQDNDRSIGVPELLDKWVIFHWGQRRLGLSPVDQNEDCSRRSYGRSILPMRCAERGKTSDEEPARIWALTACLGNLCEHKANFWLCVGWCSTFSESFPICNCANIEWGFSALSFCTCVTCTSRRKKLKCREAGWPVQKQRWGQWQSVGSVPVKYTVQSDGEEGGIQMPAPSKAKAAFCHFLPHATSLSLRYLPPQGSQ